MLSISVAQENNGKGDLLYEVVRPQSMNLSEALVECQVPYDLRLSLKLASVIIRWFNMGQRRCKENLCYHLRHTLVALVSRESLSSAISHFVI